MSPSGGVIAPSGSMSRTPSKPQNDGGNRGHISRTFRFGPRGGSSSEGEVSADSWVRVGGATEKGMESFSTMQSGAERLDPERPVGSPGQPGILNAITRIRNFMCWKPSRRRASARYWMFLPARISAGVPACMSGNPFLPSDTGMMPEECDHCQRLFEEVERHLLHIAELSREQAAAVARNDEQWVDRLDHELERSMGAKERSLGALKEHWHEHSG